MVGGKLDGELGLKVALEKQTSEDASIFKRLSVCINKITRRVTLFRWLWTLPRGRSLWTVVSICWTGKLLIKGVSNIKIRIDFSDCQYWPFQV